MLLDSSILIDKDTPDYLLSVIYKSNNQNKHNEDIFLDNV